MWNSIVVAKTLASLEWQENSAISHRYPPLNICQGAEEGVTRGGLVEPFCLVVQVGGIDCNANSYSGNDMYMYRSRYRWRNFHSPVNSLSINRHMPQAKSGILYHNCLKKPFELYIHSASFQYVLILSKIQPLFFPVHQYLSSCCSNVSVYSLTYSML